MFAVKTSPMTPKLLLKIENSTPHLYLVKDESTTRMTQIDENLSEILPAIAKKLGITESVDFEGLLEIANQADETYWDSNPEVDVESLEFELSAIGNRLADEAVDLGDEYADVEITDDLRAEMKRNQQHDTLASIMEILYKVIITKTLIAAHDLEMDKIHLQTNNNLARFVERMGKELESLGVELFIE